MAESTTVEKQDNDDSLSSEEWTIIDKKESKATDASEENSNESKEILVFENSCESEKNAKPKAENVEEEVREKEIDSDDVSVISDENEEHGSSDFEFEGRIESVKWQDLSERSLAALLPANSSRTSQTPSNVSMIIAITACLMVMAAIIAGPLVIEKNVNPLNKEMEEKLKGMSGLEAKLKELTEVKQVLDQLQTTMPDIKKLIETLTLQKYEHNKRDNSLETLKKFEEMYMNKISSFHLYDDRLETLEATYKNFCLLTNKINSSNITITNEVCKTPKVLMETLEFKKALKRVLQSEDVTVGEKRIFVEAEKKVDVLSESFLTDLTTIFSKFTTKIEERLTKFGSKFNKRLCSLNNENESKGLANILISDKFFTKYCNGSSNDESIFVSKLNSSFKEEKYNENKKKSHKELKKNSYQHDYKNMKDYKKIEDSQENDSTEKELKKEISEKSKGELKYDSNWKKNKYEKEKYFQEERKQNKQERINNNYKNEDFRKNKEYYLDDSYEKREIIHDGKIETYKKERDYEHKRDYNNKDHEFKTQYNNEYNNKNPDFKIRLEVMKKRLADYDEYLGNLEKEDMDFKEYRYVKCQNSECKNKKDKHRHSGEWQMERGKAREKLRNSDWYFVRADSRRQARSSDEAITEEEGDYEDLNNRRGQRGNRNSHPIPPPHSSSRSKSYRTVNDRKEWRAWRPRVWWASVKRNLQRFVPLKDHNFF